MTAHANTLAVTSSDLAGLRARLAADVKGDARLVPAGRLTYGMRVEIMTGGGPEVFTVEGLGTAPQPGAVYIEFTDGSRIPLVGAKDLFTVVG